MADRKSNGAGRHRLLARGAPALLGACLLAACAAPSHPLLSAARERARVIDLQRLETRAEGTPQGLEQALREGRGRAIERPPAPPAEMRLSLAQARQAALANNLDIQVQLVAPALARERASEAAARFEPSAFGSISQERQEPPDSTAAAGIDSTLTEGEVGLRVPLSNGAIATVSVGSSDLDLEPAGAADAYATSASLSISQPLLRGAGRGVNTAPITIARLQLGQEEARTRLLLTRVMADAESAYWRHYAGTRTLDIRYQQYERAREQLHQARRLAESGVIPRIEVTRARAGVARRVDDIIRAQTLRRSGERELKRIMNVEGMGVGSDTVLLATSEPNPVGLDFDVERLAAEAVEARMELLDLELQLAIDALSLDVARNDEQPLLSIDYSLNYLGNESSLADALDNAFGADRYGWRLGATLEVPLGNEAANARRRQAVLQRALTLRTRAQRQTAIRQEVHQAADLLLEAWRRILAAREETLLAARAFEAEHRQFLAGVRTSTDVLEAADFLAEAQVREVSALAEYEIARVGLAFATGSTLGQGRVRLLPYDPAAPGGEAPYGLEYPEDAGDSRSSLPQSVVSKAAAIVEQARGAVAGGDYTIQLASTPDRASARAYIEAQGLDDQAWVVDTGVRTRFRFAVLYGHYASRDDAGDALSELPPALKTDGAFVRRQP